MRYEFRKFLSDRRGNFAATFALLSIPILGIAGGATDYAMLTKQQAVLQDTADAAALAVIKELGVSNLTKAEIQSLAESYVYSNLALEDPAKKPQ